MRLHNYIILTICSCHGIFDVWNHQILGCALSHRLVVRERVDQPVAKANMTEGFPRRSLRSCTQDVQSRVYTKLVRSICIMWSIPLTAIHRLEKVQTQASRFVANKREIFATMLRYLNWVDWESCPFRLHQRLRLCGRWKLRSRDFIMKMKPAYHVHQSNSLFICMHVTIVLCYLH